MKRNFWSGLAVVGALVGLMGCGAPAGTDDDDDSSSSGDDDLASAVAGTYGGDAVIGFVPYSSYTMTVTRTGADTVKFTGNGFEYETTIWQDNDQYVSTSSGNGVEFDISNSPITLEVAMSNGDSFDGTKQ